MAYGPPPRMPSIGGYVVAVLLAVAGIVGGVLLIVSGVRSYIDKIEGFQRVPVPGGGSVQLDEGDYSIYYERPGLEDDDFAPLSVTVSQEGDSRDIPLERYDSTVSYEVSGHDGRGVFTFDADEPGTYRVRSDGPPGELAVGRGIRTSRVGPLLAMGIAVLLLTPVLGAVVALLTFLRRSKAKRVAAPQWSATGWR